MIIYSATAIGDRVRDEKSTMSLQAPLTLGESLTGHGHSVIIFYTAKMKFVYPRTAPLSILTIMRTAQDIRGCVLFSSERERSRGKVGVVLFIYLFFCPEYF